MLISKWHTVDGVHHHLLVVEAGEGGLFLRDGVELMIFSRYSDYLLFDWLVRFQHLDRIVMRDVFLDYNLRDSFSRFSYHSSRDTRSSHHNAGG